MTFYEGTDEQNKKTDKNKNMFPIKSQKWQTQITQRDKKEFSFLTVLWPVWKLIRGLLYFCFVLSIFYHSVLAIVFSILFSSSIDFNWHDPKNAKCA